MGRCFSSKVKWYLMTIRYEDYSSKDHKVSIQTLKFSNKNVYAKSLESVKCSCSVVLSDSCYFVYRSLRLSAEQLYLLVLQIVDCKEVVC